MAKANVPATLLVTGGRSLRIPLSLSFAHNPSDPLVVTMTVLDDDKPVVWVFGRDLLRDGLRSNATSVAGQGDVRFWAETGNGRDVLVIRLDSPFGTAVIEAPHSIVNVFLKAAFLELPDGAEDGLILDALDRELHQLLEDR